MQRISAKSLLSLPRPWKQAILLSFDFVALSAALWASYCLRYDEWTLPASLNQWLITFAAPTIAIPVFIRMGLYRAVLRYLPERALWTILRAMAISAILWVIAAFLTAMIARGTLPRSVPIIYWALGSLFISSSRLSAKWILWPSSGKNKDKRPSVIIYGAGEAGTQLASSLASSHFIVGFVDDDPSLHGREVAGIRVHAVSALPALVRDHGVKQVILSIPSLPQARRREIVAQLSGQGLSIQSLPGLADLVTGKYLVSQIREIEIDELLGRSSVPPDPVLIRDMIFGRTILVTGAGGSIGSELCRKIAQWRPQRLILVEANEFALYRIDRELSPANEISVVPVLGSVLNEALMRRTIEQHGVEAVFHAAAHKHVPMVEANALEGMRNNIFGTRTITRVSFECGVENFVLISTDKAVRPTNVMGATKRWAELVVREMAARAAQENRNQKFCSVRFGNVLGSNGSVVPLFKEQIAKGGPVTVTDPAMTRYFMSIQEAAELIVQAGALSEGGDVFLLDMGEPISIMDLAENMIQLAGFSVRSNHHPDGDIEIAVTGKRPGEKLYEELFYDSALAAPTQHPKIMHAPARPTSVNALTEALKDLDAAISSDDEQLARRLLFDMIRDRERQTAVFV